MTEYIYPLLKKNHYFGPNIKRLKGEYSGLYRYRIGKFRLFYEIDNDKIIVFIIDIEDRKDAYN
ncbi:MAG: type II toxin-antitoxin system RelE/ParE family toxin [Spirochaetales bacterium]|uniref:Type II toxin-antitoxin system RelE/ParE family toxin n=1 Tax=Candidatus Thalassospirochaeta sargassi TaxID=3119039 RepID=A0AAJ1ID25_9SPIO|nr:type II toxin-antitoxin system RelE/ParE family toxin [Spirochaetales bacterium]